MNRRAFFLFILLLALVPLALLSAPEAQAQEPDFGLDTFRAANPALDSIIIADILAGSSEVYASGRFGTSGIAVSGSDLDFDTNSTLILLRSRERGGNPGGELQINDDGPFHFGNWLSDGGEGLEYSVYLMLASDATTTHSFPLQGNVLRSGGNYLNISVPAGAVQRAWGSITLRTRFVFAIARSGPANNPPAFAESSYGRTVPENSPAGTTVGSPIAATDADADHTISYSLSGTGSDQFAVDSAGQITVATGASLDRETTPSYSLTLTATDDGTVPASGTTTVNVSIGNVNEPPVFGAASYSRTVDENSGAGSTVGTPVTATDPDVGDTATYSLSGAGSTLFAVSGTGQITVASGAALDHESTDSYTLTLTVQDAAGLSDTATVAITIRDVNERPSIPDASYTRSVDENAATGTALGTAIVATDPDDADTLRYSLSGTGAGDFAVSSTGQISTAAALDHEGTDSYSLTLTATDSGGLTDSATVTITVNDLNERPSFASSSYSRLVSEASGAGTQVGAPIPATDPDSGDTLSYSLSGTGSNLFRVSASGQITTAGILRFSDGARYVLTLTATDSGNLRATTSVTINVAEVNEAPAFAESSYDRSVNENSVAGTQVGGPIAASDGDDDTLVYALSGSGSALFSVDAGGQITVATGAVLNHEDTDSYTLTLRATDDATLPLSATTTVNISVNDVNETPTFADASHSRQVNENSPAGARLGNAITATDPDDGDTLTYSLSGTGNGNFSVSGTGQITVSGSGLGAGAASYSLTLTATDSGNLTATATVRISVRDVNDPPAFAEASYTRAVDENSNAGVAVGAPISASDPDTGDTLSYSLSGTGAGDFTVSATGQIAVAPNAALDHETSSSYSITITVRDRAGLTDTASVTVNVNNVNEAPTFRLSTYTRSVSIRAQADDSVPHPIPAIDPDTGDTVSYSLSGTNSGSFNVSSTGQITVSASGLVSGVTAYSLIITARDGAGLTDTAQVTIRVNDDNRAPTFSLSLYIRTVQDGTPSGTSVGAPIRATDADSDPLEYRLSGTGNANFSVDGSGQISTASVIRYSDRSRYDLTLMASDPYGRSATTNVRITVPPPPPSIDRVSVDLDEDAATITVTVANPSGSHTVLMRYRAGRSSWTQPESQSTTGAPVTFQITDLAPGQDYRVEVSLDDISFASPKSATFHVPTPEAEALRESVDLLVMGTDGVFEVDPDGFTFFGVEYQVEELAQEDSEIRMVLVGICPAAWTADSLTLGNDSLVPSQSCTESNQLTLRAEGTLSDGDVLTLSVKSMHITDRGPSDGIGHSRGTLRDTICALPDTILGESACVPIMLFVPPLVLTGLLLGVFGVTNPMVLSGVGLVSAIGMSALMIPGPILVVGFILASLGLGALFLLIRR